MEPENFRRPGGIAGLPLLKHGHLVGGDRGMRQKTFGEGGGIETVRQQGYRFSLDTIPEPGESLLVSQVR